MVSEPKIVKSDYCSENEKSLNNSNTYYFEWLIASNF